MTKAQLQLKTGGTLDPRKHVYIQRPEDEELLRLLLQREYCNVLTSRQMGKSSLMIRTVLKLNAYGVSSVMIDMGGEFGTPTNAEEWYLGLLNKINWDLKLGLDIERWWGERPAGANNQKLLDFFRSEMASRRDSPVVIFLDEIDSTLKLDFRDDLFTAIRAMYNERPIVPEYERVTFCLLGVAIPNELIKDSHTTPYNVGKTVQLRDFDITRDDLSPLAQALDAAGGGGAALRKILGWTGGHPYLTLRLCDEFNRRGCKSPDKVAQLVKQVFASFDAVRDDVHFQYIARFLTTRLSAKVPALSLYRDIRRGKRVYDTASQVHIQLKLSGIVKRDERGELRLRNRIYSRIFTASWVNTALLPQERQEAQGHVNVSDHVFISHSGSDDRFVKDLREALEAFGLEVWTDSRPPVNKGLAPEVAQAIRHARQVIVVLSPTTVTSDRIRQEVQVALETERERQEEGYRVVPLLLPDFLVSALRLWFDEEPLVTPIRANPNDLKESLPAILSSLGVQRLHTARTAPVEELILKLDDLKVLTEGGKRRARAVARLVYEPADTTAPAVEGKRFNFTAPLGVLEAEELRWYLEEFYVWPIGIFRERAARVEARLPEWGRALYDAALAPQAAQETLRAWQQAGAEGERRFSVFVERELPEGASPEEQAAADEVAAELLALPWELLHDGRGFLFHGERAARVRRRLPNRHTRKVTPTRLPIRILLVSPRPEDERTPYLDHRISARPLIEALESLGELAKLSILTPPTFPALEKTLRKAADAGEPFDVVHFDGHGVYDRRVGLGALCFEDPKDTEGLERRAVQLIHAAKLAEVIRDRRIPLVFLEACQTAKTEDDPTASVAATLLEKGVASIVAMSHSVLVETARRFVRTFYRELAEGKRVGIAMLAGQRELHRDTYRGRLMGAGDFRLQDWFVPVLYQEEQDAQLVTRLPSEDVRQLQAAQRRLSLGHLPELPHEFQGRSRELLKLERLLAREPYAVIRGRGGEGKTTLAVELARWLVRTARHARAAFVSFEQYTDARQVLIGLGRQLLPEGDKWHVGQDEDVQTALQPVERALRDRPTVIVLDNLESVLPDQTGRQPAGAAPLPELFDLCRRLLDASPATRIVFTTREPLPAPFDRRGNEIALDALAREDAVALVGEVLKQEGLTSKADDPGGDPKEITDLVEAVDRHARALVLLARELARGGVRATTDNLRRLMADLDRKHPGDRENSLYASLELSLRRLPPATREQLKPLAVFHGGAHLYVLQQMLGAEPEAVMSLARQLIEVGLAADMGDGHVRLDPALPAYLLRELSEAEQEELRAVWAGGMFALTSFLYQQFFKDAEVSTRLTLLELPNLLSMLTWALDKAAPEAIVELAQGCETLFSNLGLRQALAQATKVREQAAEKLGEWGSARRLTESADIDRLLERGEVRAAYAAAEALLKRCLSAGEGAYENAGYDIAYVQWQLGRVLQIGGAAEAALAQLGEAGRRFQALADAGDVDAAGMASAVITESGDCLAALGRMDEAAAAYEESIRRSEALNNKRTVAVGKGQLAATRMLQQRYAEALEIYDETRRIFESLGEPKSVAVILHQVGMAYRHMGQFEQAERAYRQSLAIKVQQKDLAGEAASLSELGALYVTWGRLEEAAKCFRQAADIYVRLKDENGEGLVRSNLAFTLLQMQQHDEARGELLRAIECKEPYGHAGELWKTWNILHNLEQASGNAEAAARARVRAVESYLAYRRAGGQSMDFGARLCAAAAQAIEQGETAELERRLTELSGEDGPPPARVLLAKVQAVLRGERGGALAADPELNYADAVELRLLLEVLGHRTDMLSDPTLNKA